MIKGKRRDEDTGENIQDNNGTKMATAPAMGRPLASRLPHRPLEPRMTIRSFNPLSFDGVTTGVTRWNRQADLRHHHRRYASTVSSLSTSASPPLPLSHQTLRRSDAWLASLRPSVYRDSPSRLITHFLAIFFLFLGPFIVVFWLLI